MKKQIIITALTLLITTISFAQKNALKFHAVPFAWGEFRFGYERSLNNLISIQGNVGVFYDKIPSFIHNIETVENYFETYSVKNTLRGFSSSVDLKIHFLGSSSLKGFYLAPYIKYHKYTFNTPASFDYSIEASDFTELTPEQQQVANQVSNGSYDIEITGTLDGKINQIGVGVGIGWQFIIGKVLVLDINPIGIGFEMDQVDIDLTTDVNNVDYEKWLPYVQEEVRSIEYVGDKIDVSAKANGINMKGAIPLPTYRGSLSIGFAF